MKDKKDITNVDNVIKEDNKNLANKNSKNKKIGIIVMTIILIIILITIGVFCLKNFKSNNNSSNTIVENKKYSKYRIANNSLQNFDLYFMQLDNSRKNKVYSPLSIKYALEMLEAGSNGESKEQLNNIIGNYTSKKYRNSQNLSLANGLFVRDGYKDMVRPEYVETIKNKYNAEVVFDSFNTPDVLNNWVDKKTFGLIKNVSDDISNYNYILTNSLAIDMNWKNPIQSRSDFYDVDFSHEGFVFKISPLVEQYNKLKFGDLDYDTAALKFGAVANKYDIISALGEDKIRNTVKTEYIKWANSLSADDRALYADVDADTFVNQYVDELKKYYKHSSQSTDFSYYTDDNVKVFAKDLQQYDGTTLQYIGIMPVEEELDSFIKNTNAEDLDKIINNLQEFNYDDCKDGAITHVFGYVPMFNIDYELSLKDNLKTLGITDVFDAKKVDLSNLTTVNDSVIVDVKHKTNMDFSNEGIKASAATIAGGFGSTGGSFNYKFEVPIVTIDLTFDKPFMFILRDKDTNESWFTGTVYEPTKWTKPVY